MIKVLCTISKLKCVNNTALVMHQVHATQPWKRHKDSKIFIKLVAAPQPHITHYETHETLPEFHNSK